MFPYCGLRDDILHPEDPRMEMADWDCVRGVTLGITSISILLIALYASFKIGLVWYGTKGWYSLNLLMLSLASMQCFLTSIRYLLHKDQRLTYTAAYLRGLQTLIACGNYGKAASESNPVYSKYYLPSLLFFVSYLTIIYFVALSMKEFDCYHPHWVVMSVSQMIIVILFSFPAITVSRNLSSIDATQVHSTILNSESSHVAQLKRALWILWVVNAIGSVSQLTLDTWLHGKYSEQTNCAILNSAYEELVRIFLKAMSYDVPVIAMIYVYYWLPRKLFETSLDVQIVSHHSFLDGEFEMLSDDLLPTENAVI